MMNASNLIAALLLSAASPSIVPADPERNAKGEVDRASPTCTMFASRDLYVGAGAQRVDVQGGPTCEQELALESGDRFSLVGKTATGTAEIVVTFSVASSSWFSLQTDDSEALVAVRGSWSVFKYGKMEKPVATLALNVEELKPEFSLLVNYRTSELQTLLETHPVPAGTLVVDPTLAPTPTTNGDKVRVSNRLYPVFPRGFPVVAPTGHEWKVELGSAHVKLCDVQNNAIQEDCSKDSISTRSLRLIELASRVAVEKPVSLSLSLVQTAGSKDALMKLDVEVAQRTAHHELPLPLEQIAYVTCPIRRGVNRGIRAERGGTLDAARVSLRDGECELLLSEELLLQSLADRHKQFEAEVRDSCPSGKGYYAGETCVNVTKFSHPDGSAASDPRSAALDFAKLYGKQSAYVCVTPETSSDGSGVKCAAIEYDPRLKPERRFTVTLPIDAQNLLDPSRTYDVEIVRAKSLEEAVKADGVLVARLRSRGAFGVRSTLPGGSVRFYLTAPVNVAAMQFPSSLHDLRTSDDTRGMQLVGLDIGLKFAIEVWNYRYAENPWPLNPVFVPAALFFRNFGTDPADQTRTRAILANGIEIRLPLVRGANQADVAFALGLFHGRDLRHSESQFLVTLGIDVLSIFGAASDAN